MSNANDLDAQTRNQDAITAGSLAECRVRNVAGDTINVGQGEHLLLNLDMDTGTIQINLPDASSATRTGVVVDAYCFAGANATWRLIVNAPGNGLSCRMNNNENAAGVAAMTRDSVAVPTLTYDSEDAGGTISFGLLQIRSCGVVGYTVLMNSQNMDWAV